MKYISDTIFPDIKRLLKGSFFENNQQLSGLESNKNTIKYIRNTLRFLILESETIVLNHDLLMYQDKDLIKINYNQSPHKVLAELKNLDQSKLRNNQKQWFKFAVNHLESKLKNHKLETLIDEIIQQKLCLGDRQLLTQLINIKQNYKSGNIYKSQLMDLLYNL